MKQHTQKIHNITIAKKQNICVKYFFQKFWLWKRTIVTEKKLRVGGPAYQPLSCATSSLVTSHPNLLRHTHTPTCYDTLTPQLATSHSHPKLLRHTHTPTCYVTLTPQLATSHSHPNLLCHTHTPTCYVTLTPHLSHFKPDDLATSPPE